MGDVTLDYIRTRTDCMPLEGEGGRRGGGGGGGGGRGGACDTHGSRQVGHDPPPLHERRQMGCARGPRVARTL